jgi:pimeloyl-ACP methyl ester carboxylesterase
VAGAFLALIVVAALAVPSAPAGARPARLHGAPATHRPAATRTTAPKTSSAPPAVLQGTGPPFEVLPETVRFFDPSRSTPARGAVPASAGRVLVTDLFVPSGAPGPLPLVVFAHGWNSNPGVYLPLLQAWAAAGFLVAAPVFPDSTDLYPGSPVSDYADQARDISFVITALLRRPEPRIDPTRIAVAGHSDGGTDVALLALDPAYADSRVRAYVCMAGELPSGVAPYQIGATAPALLVAAGSADEYDDYAHSITVFDVARPSAKAMVVDEGGTHLGSFVAATADAAAMREETTRFLELTMEPRLPSSAAVVSAMQPVGSPAITVVAPP